MQWKSSRCNPSNSFTAMLIKDRELRDELHKHLAALRNAGRITSGDHEVVSGISILVACVYRLQRQS